MNRALDALFGDSDETVLVTQQTQLSLSPACTTMKTRKFLICAQKYRYCIRILHAQLSANHKRDQGANLKIDNGRASATYGTTVSSSFDYEAARRHGGYAEGYLRNGSRSSH